MSDLAGNTLATAREVSLTAGLQSFRDRVDGLDTNDYYRFSLSATSTLSASLTNLSGDADLQLLNSSGVVIQGAYSSGQTDAVQRLLSPGTYYLRVFPYSNADYSLSLSATAPPIYKYSFTYYYNGSNSSSDYYTGEVYAYANTYTVGSSYDPSSRPNQTGANGRYAVNSSTVAGTAADVGKVFVTDYYDVDFSGDRFTPHYNRTGAASGLRGLGSEYDFIYSGMSGAWFGGDLQEADLVVPPSVSLAVTDATAAETSSGQSANPGQFTISRTGRTTAALTVNYAIGGSATNGTDYSQLSGSVVIPVGQSSVTLPITVINDATIEPSETVTLTLLAGSSYVLSSRVTGAVTIADNDVIDLRGTFFDATPEPLNAGSTFTANFRVQNAGTVSSSGFRVGFYLSSDSTITTSDRLLGSYDLSSLAANTTTATFGKSLTLPGATDAFWSGNKLYYIGMVVDSLGAIAESNETNNANIGLAVDYDDVSITTTPPIADLRGAFLDATPESLTAGGSFSISFKVQNAGTANAGAFKIGFYLSTDSLITTSDRLLNTYNLPSLAANTTTANIGGTLILPSSSDAFWSGSKTYYIGMVVDCESAITESNETNNANQGNGVDWDDVSIAVTIPTVKDPVMGMAPKTNINGIDALLTSSPDNYYWNTSGNNGIISYSFYAASSGKYYGTETVSEVSNAVKTNVRSILASLESFINVRFVEVADTASSYGVLRYMLSSISGYAFAYYPHTQPIGGDVHLSYYDAADFAEGLGSYGYATLIHETFHALGLKHPGNYNAGGGGTVGPYLSSSEDNNTNTVMSYNNGGYGAGSEAITPMAYDIRALQYLYGAKNNNATATTYAFSNVYNYKIGSQSFGSTTTQLKQSIWDSGGVDTLDFSALSAAESYRFDLSEGGIITTQAAYNASTYDYWSNGTTSTFGTTIAYNTVIENLIASRGNDTIVANSASNRFKGYSFGTASGTDVIEGSNTADVLELTGYTLSNLTTTINGSDLTIGFGSNGSVQIKGYYGPNGSMKAFIGNSYYTYSATGGWKTTTAPSAPAAGSMIASTGGLTATAPVIPVATNAQPVACACPACRDRSLSQLGSTSLLDTIAA